MMPCKVARSIITSFQKLKKQSFWGNPLFNSTLVRSGRQSFHSAYRSGFVVPHACSATSQNSTIVSPLFGLALPPMIRAFSHNTGLALS